MKTKLITSLNYYIHVALLLCLPAMLMAQNSLKTIVIDAGHGGKDNGAHGKFANEKDVALSVSLMVGKLIEQKLPDVKVKYTRKTDEFIELGERANIANDIKADLFICIHCNSACVRDAKTKKDRCNETKFGVETYVMGLHKSKGNLEVARRENESILLEKDYKKNYDGFDPSSDEASIIFSMHQNVNLDNSINFASKVQTQTKSMGRNDRDVIQAGFLVLWKTAMPAVLIETGYLTNAEEEKFLASTRGQQKMAFSIFKAIREYKYELEGKTLTEAERNEKPILTGKEEDDVVVKTPVDTIKPIKIIKPNIVVVTPKDTAKPKLYTNPKNGTISTDAILFKIQLVSADKKIPLNSPAFKGNKTVEENFSDGFFRYTTTRASTLDEALKNLDSVKNEGFKDAFITAYKGKTKISVSEAKNMLNSLKN
ncbi:MAG: N-acetylmuramoyl-L-alanine amidase [Bacteroidia bacterium]